MLATVAWAQGRGTTAEWPFVGSDQAHSKYSVAEEVTAANVSDLEIIWEWEPKEVPLGQ